MSTTLLFNHWRQIKNPNKSWGLAWFLANEFCKRYYSSHGIAPWVINHEGLGYYGITLNNVTCSKNNIKHEPYGRMTICGNVENWRIDGPGGHGFHAIDMCVANIPTEDIVQQAIAYMNLDPLPLHSHLHCRHKRWGASYQLCFEVATILALRNEVKELCITNNPIHTKRAIVELDPKITMNEHLGGFLFSRSDKQLLLAADGRLLDGSNKNLWLSYMNGAGIFQLADMLEQQLNAMSVTKD